MYENQHLLIALVAWLVIRGSLLTMLKSSSLWRAILLRSRCSSVRALMLWIAGLTIALPLMPVALALLIWLGICWATWSRERVVGRILVVRVRHDCSEKRVRCGRKEDNAVK